MSLSAISLIELTMRNGDNSYQYSKSKDVYKVNAQARVVSDEAASLRKTIRKLSQYDSFSSTKKTVQKQMEKFTDEYNAMLKNEGKVDDKNYRKSFKQLKELVDNHKYKLKKIGFAYDEDSKRYKLDLEKFDEASNKELEKLFANDDSFMVKAEKLVKKLHKTANAKIDTTQRQTHIGTIQLGKQQFLAATAAMNSVTVLSNLRKLSQSGTMDEERSELTNIYLDAFAEQLTAFTKCSADSDETESVEALLNLFNEHQSEFKELGFKLTTDDYDGSAKLIYHEQDWTGDTEEAQQRRQIFDTLFGGASDSFGVKAEALSKKIFRKAMQLDKSGIVVDEYV